MPPTNQLDERILILAPTGRDAEVARATLSRAALEAEVCSNDSHLLRELALGAGAALLTQEALSEALAEPLRAVFRAQPPWSDLPVVALISGGPRAARAPRPEQVLGAEANVTVLERPVQAATLVRAAEVALRSRRRQYEQRAHLQARAQAEADARQARVMAEGTLRLRDQLLASVTHDLRNPLGTIKGYAQMLQRNAQRGMVDPARLEQGLAQIDRLVTRTLVQIDELLDVARLQAGQPLPLDRRPVDLVALVQQLVSEARATNPHHEVELHAAHPEVIGVWDARRLERAVGNLLANAVKYSPEGGRIVVTLDGEPDEAELRVQDQGIGIPAADLPRMFEPFHRASNAAGRLPGVGLGLAGVKQIVELHGGTVAIESAEGQGTTVILRLPVVERNGGNER